jgi:6,7-dimethyl-8-ribityllumazine synthase
MNREQIRTHEGKLLASGFRFAIVVSRFNGFITERLLEGALDGLERTGCAPEAVEIARVPGSRETPLVALELARSGRFDAVICLGAVIRGETTHYDYVAQEVSKGVAQVAMETGVPTIFGVLTCDTLEQAIDRAGAKSGNKGFEAALNAIEMAHLMKQLRKKK